MKHRTRFEQRVYAAFGFLGILPPDIFRPAGDLR